jgi:hypothetical protein
MGVPAGRTIESHTYQHAYVKGIAMLSQKPSSPLAKLGDAYSLLVIPILFIIGGLLLARHVPLMWVFVLSILPLLALQLVFKIKYAVCAQQSESQLSDSQHIEWIQVVGKDGEVVEVGHIKKRAQTDVC